MSSKIIFVKKKLQISYRWPCSEESESKRQPKEWKHADSPLKKKSRVQKSLKKCTDRPIVTDFLEKDTIVNSTSYCQVLR